jgi:hypothetical protein
MSQARAFVELKNESSCISSRGCILMGANAPVPVAVLRYLKPVFFRNF